MPVLQLNTTITEEDYEKAGSAFAPVPAGKVEAFIYEIEVNEVKNDGPNKGKPRLKFTFKIAEGQKADDGTDVGGRLLWLDVNYFESANKKTGKMQLPFQLTDLGKALGKTLEEIKNLDTDDWVGEENSLQVKVEVVPKRVQVDGEWVDSSDPDEKTNRIGSFRSLENAAVSVKAGAKAKSKGFKLV